MRLPVPSIPPIRTAWPLSGRAADAAVALGSLAVVAVATIAMSAGTSGHHRPWAGWALAVIACGALYWRRTRPVLAGLVSGTACAAYYPLTEPDGPVLLAFVIALYTAAAEGHVLAAGVLGGLALVNTGYSEANSDVNHLADAGMFLLAGWLLAIVAVGGVAHNRRAYLREAERRVAAAEHGREEEARRRATEERLRIAREVHDLLGHNISLINVQAAAALHGLAQEPERAEAALTAIKQASKETLRELRATLGVLRQVDEAEPDAPVAGLDRLAELASGAAAAGLAVRAETEGDPGPLPADTDLAAYRIVQEALTNVTRHSDAAGAVVRVRYTDGAVLVEIEDDGQPLTGTAGTGSGILGMRERAEALGGDLTAGPRAGGGFSVRARLPRR